MFFKPLTTLATCALAGVIAAQVAFAGGMGGGGPTVPIGFTGNTATSFGLIDVTVGTGNIDMGTDGTITYGAGYSGAATGTPGGFVVTGDTGFTVDISCSATGVIANARGGTMNLTNIEFVIDKGNNAGAFGTGNACLGVGNTSLSIAIRNNTSQNTFAVGMRIDGTSGVPFGAGLFSTSNAGGTPITFDVVYQ